LDIVAQSITVPYLGTALKNPWGR